MEAFRPKILCVDDEPLNLRLLELVLGAKGYEIIKAEDGSDALNKLAAHKIDIVLLDVMMPGIDGFEVCRRIKGSKQYGNIPVVLITSLNSSEDRIRGIEAGAEDFIAKPFDKAEVLARVKMLLNVKDLNDRLSSSYENIVNLISFGEEIITSFRPMEFRFMTSIDAFVGHILRKSADEIWKPGVVLVCIAGEQNAYSCYMYEFASGMVQRKQIDPQILLVGLLCQRSGTMFLNEAVDSPMFGSVRKALKAGGTEVDNLVAYCSSELYVLALNYGKNVSEYDAEVLKSLVNQSMFLKSLSSQITEVQNAFTYTVHALARASEANDEDTGNHILRVGDYCAILAQRLGMDETFIEEIRLQSLMHDVGKIHVHPDILKKPGKLTPEEWTSMKLHTDYGARILGDHHRLRMAKTIAYSHHERWDGSGYPLGLSGDAIPIEGRIMSIADQYDALRNARVYKPAFDHQKTLKIIIEGDGRTMPAHFDPDVLRAFTEAAAEFEEIYEKLKG